MKVLSSSLNMFLIGSLFLIIGGIATSCSRTPGGIFYDFEEAIPEVTIDSVTTIAENTIAVHARLNKLGDVPLTVLAASIGPSPGFDVVRNPQERVFSLLGDRFTVVFEEVEEGDTLYAIALVGHEYGLVQSEYFPFIVGKAPAPKAPCDYPLNQIKIFNTTHQISGTSQFPTIFGNYRLEFDASSAEMQLDFQDTLTSGIYETVSFDRFVNIPEEREVYARSAEIFVGAEPILPGGEIYVTVLPDGSLQLEGCELYTVFQGDTLLQQFNVTVN